MKESSEGYAGMPERAQTAGGLVNKEVEEVRQMTDGHAQEMSKSLLSVLEMAHPLWPLFVGQPETGEPVELSKKSFEHLKVLLRKSVAAERDVPRAERSGSITLAQGANILRKARKKLGK